MRMLMLCVIVLVFSACGGKSPNQAQNFAQTNTHQVAQENPKQTPLNQLTQENFTQAILTQSPRVQNSAQSPRQVSPDTPKDTPIAVRVQGNAKWCYAPQFSASAQNYSYLALISCSRGEALNARYDVLSRLAYKINNTWICITAPTSVYRSEREVDMLYLSPCVVNDERQQWKIKNGQFWSYDDRYSIKDDGDFLYAAWLGDESYNEHILDSAMREWEATVAPAETLTFGFFLFWQTKNSQTAYYVSNGSSTTTRTAMYYDLERGHIASYDAFVPRLNCMYSNLNGGDWDWVEWGKCDDTTPPPKNRAFFKPILIGNKKLAIKDANGNYLRLTHYGTHWGVPYVVKPSYMQKDSANEASSEFLTTTEFQNWLRLISANEGDNLPFCPAPGGGR